MPRMLKEYFRVHATGRYSQNGSSEGYEVLPGRYYFYPNSDSNLDNTACLSDAFKRYTNVLRRNKLTATSIRVEGMVVRGKRK
jgi:hypothetical protein